MANFRPQAVKHYVSPEAHGRLVRTGTRSGWYVALAVAVAAAALVGLSLAVDVPVTVEGHGVVHATAGEAGRTGYLAVPAKHRPALAVGDPVRILVEGDPEGAERTARIRAIRPQLVDTDTAQRLLGIPSMPAAPTLLVELDLREPLWPGALMTGSIVIERRSLLATFLPL